MDFLGIGIPEVIVVIILALIFIGPRDLPKLAGRFAKFLRDLRMMSEGFRTEWQREMQAATRIEGLKELRDELIETRDALREAGRDVTDAMTIDLEELEAEGAATAEKASSEEPDEEPEVEDAVDDLEDSLEVDVPEDNLENEAPIVAEKPAAESNGAAAKASEPESQPTSEEKPTQAKAAPAAKNGETSKSPIPAKPAKPEPAPSLPETLQIDLEEFETRTIQPPAEATTTDNGTSDTSPVEAKDSD